jgi:hypothetical protein
MTHDLTAGRAAITLMRERLRRGFVLPSYTPANWWECDVFEVTSAMFFREYEIKLTRSDFKADAHKESAATRRFINGVWTEQPAKNKHACMGQPNGPRQFWYVVPEGLIEPSEIPQWAGLIYLRDAGKGRKLEWRWFESEIVKAPFLHRTRLDPKIKAHAESVCYWRMHKLAVRVQQLTKRNEHDETTTKAEESNLVQRDQHAKDTEAYTACLESPGTPTAEVRP